MTFNYKQLLSQVTEYHSDPLTILSQVEEVRRLALEEGVLSDKVHQKEGVVECNERNPGTAVAALKLKFDILKWLVERADREVIEDVSCQLIVPGLDLTRPEEMKRYGS